MFLRSFRRFASRRGLPAVVKSDNGKTFKAAADIIKAIVEESAVSKYLQSTRVRWTFNVEKAPWWGGFFERLIKGVKRCMKKILQTSHLTEEELLKLLLEVEATLNSRPLTYVSTEDVREPLTPSHLLCGFRVCHCPIGLVRRLMVCPFGGGMHTCNGCCHSSGRDGRRIIY